MNPRQPSFGCSDGKGIVTLICRRQFPALIAPLCQELRVQMESKLNSLKSRFGDLAKVQDAEQRTWFMQAWRAVSRKAAVFSPGKHT